MCGRITKSWWINTAAGYPLPTSLIISLDDELGDSSDDDRSIEVISPPPPHPPVTRSISQTAK